MVGLEDEFLFIVLDVAVLLIAPPEFVGRGKGIEREFALDVLSGGRDFVVGGERVAVGAEGAGDVDHAGVAQGLLHPVADSVVVVLRFDDGDGYPGFPKQNVVRKFLLLLVSGRHIPPDDDGSWGKRDLATDLSKLIPTSAFDCRCDEEITDVDFAECLFFLLGHDPICPIRD